MVGSRRGVGGEHVHGEVVEDVRSKGTCRGRGDEGRERSGNASPTPLPPTVKGQNLMQIPKSS